MRTNRSIVKIGTSALCALVLQAFPGPAPIPAVRAKQAPRVAPAARESVRFEANLGQVAGDSRFLARTGGATVLFAPQSVVYQLTKLAPPADRTEPPAIAATAEITSRLVGASLAPDVEGVGELPGRTHYFVGNDPSKWIRDVPSYGRVVYHGVYEGVDVVYYGRGPEIEYDFLVAPGADPSAIRLAFDGAERVDVDGDGALVVGTAAGPIRQAAPVVYQDRGRGREPVGGRYVVEAGGLVGFDLGEYDRAAPLVIDPVVAYDVTVAERNQSRSDIAASCTLDRFDNTYVIGEAGAVGGYTDIRVEKYNSAGQLVFRTFVGSSHYDTGTAVAVDQNSNVYFAGYTAESDFPTTPSAAQPASAGLYDVVVGKLNSGGSSLLYSTYLGGTESDYPTAIKVDASSSAYVAGLTRSGDFPVHNGFQMSYSPTQLDYQQGFVTKIAPSGDSVVYSTFLGGNASDSVDALAVDGTGVAYATGTTYSPNFPLRNPMDATFAGSAEVFVTKIAPSGSSLVYSTFLGGNNWDIGGDIAIDASGDVYVAGTTDSPDFPIVGPSQHLPLTYDYDVFATKLNPSGSAIVFSTRIGGTENTQTGAGREFGGTVALAASGEVYVAGTTSTAQDFPLVNPLPGAVTSGLAYFVTKLGPAGSPVAYSTTVGVTQRYGYTPLDVVVAADSHGSATVLYRDVQDAPTSGYFDTSHLIKIVNSADLRLTMSATPSPVPRGQNLTYRITVTNLSPEPATDAVVTMTMPAQTTFVSVSGSQGQFGDGPLPGGNEPVVFNLGAVAPNATATVTVVVKVAKFGVTSLTGQASVGTASSDPAPSNNSTTRTTPVS